MANKEATVRDRRQASDILRAAKVYEPAIVPALDVDEGEWIVYSGSVPLGRGATIHDAMVDAKLWPPPRPSAPQFAAHDLKVKRGLETVATTSSKTMAYRIANALNQYVPNERGR